MHYTLLGEVMLVTAAPRSFGNPLQLQFRGDRLPEMRAGHSQPTGHHDLTYKQRPFPFPQ